jgi:hypothetical protein
MQRFTKASIPLEYKKPKKKKKKKKKKKQEERIVIKEKRQGPNRTSLSRSKQGKTPTRQPIGCRQLSA